MGTCLHSGGLNGYVAAHEERYCEFPKCFSGLTYTRPNFRLVLDGRLPDNQKRCLNEVFETLEPLPTALLEVYFRETVDRFGQSEPEFVLDYVKRLHRDCRLEFDWTFLFKKTYSALFSGGAANEQLTEQINEFIIAAGIRNPNAALDRESGDRKRSIYPPFIAANKYAENILTRSIGNVSFHLGDSLADMQMYRRAGCDPRYRPDWCRWYTFEDFLDLMFSMVSAGTAVDYAYGDVMAESLDCSIAPDDLNEHDALRCERQTRALLRYVWTIHDTILPHSGATRRDNDDDNDKARFERVIFQMTERAAVRKDEEAAPAEAKDDDDNDEK